MLNDQSKFVSIVFVCWNSNTSSLFCITFPYSCCICGTCSCAYLKPYRLSNRGWTTARDKQQLHSSLLWIAFKDRVCVVILIWTVFCVRLFRIFINYAIIKNTVNVCKITHSLCNFHSLCTAWKILWLKFSFYNEPLKLAARYFSRHFVQLWILGLDYKTLRNPNIHRLIWVFKGQ